jgi:hypothetical protein
MDYGNWIELFLEHLRQKGMYAICWYNIPDEYVDVTENPIRLAEKFFNSGSCF